MNPLNVAWLVSNVKTAEPSELFATELASSRMRAGVCIRSLSQTPGIRVLPLNLVGTEDLPAVAFMSKYVHDSGANLYMHDGGSRWNFWTEQVSRIKSAGGKLVVDYTDHHLAGNDIRTKWYQHILGQVDGFVVPSEKMADNARQYWSGPIWLVPEPIEIPIMSPAPSAPQGPIRALWFGHNSNLPYLYRFIQREMHHCPPMSVKILTNFLDQNVLKSVIATAPSSAAFSIGKWSIASMLQAAQTCDVALIPSDRSDPRKNGAGSNRLTTALALGLVPVVEMIDSYRPFSSYCIDLSDHAALRGLRDQIDSMKQHVLQAQGSVVQDYTSERVGPRWVSIVKELAGLPD